MQQKSNKPTWGQVSYTLYFIGTALVVGSWFHLVPFQIGRMGWVVAMIGWAIPYYLRWHNARRRK